MRTIIAGSRSISDQNLVNNCISSCGWKITQVVSGGAVGVDRCGEIWALTRDVPIVRFLPDWSKYGIGAGMLRNARMADHSEALVLIWDGESKGSEHMLRAARQFGLKIFLHRTDNPVEQPDLAL